jgi:hypothetical protein
MSIKGLREVLPSEDDLGSSSPYSAYRKEHESSLGIQLKRGGVQKAEIGN